MHKRIKVKLYPTHKQAQMLENHMDAYRYCYNLCLEYKKTLWDLRKINISGYDMAKELLQLRHEVPWLKSCKAECIREAAYQVDRTYKNFFGGKGYPKFKAKKNYQGFHAYQAVFSTDDSNIKFFKNKIKFKSSGEYKELLQGHKIKQITFKKDKCGNFWATCLIETKDVPKLPKVSNSVGVDLGIKHLATTSNGDTFENYKYFENSYYKLRKLQRKFSKTKKGGKNKEKLRIKVAKVYQKCTNQREWYYHQIVNKLISENQTIVVETLSVKNMVKNRKLSRVISDVSWGLFTQILEYKCNWYGRELIKVDRWFPSSKTCSNCGNVKEELKLSERTYECNSCGLSIDRDVNAAINIRNEGLKIPGLPVEDTTNR